MSPEMLKIVEVGPRDGLQNVAPLIPTAMKIQFIHDLAQSGLTTIEATSFVAAQWVPQLSDHAEVLQALDTQGDIHYPVLIPNSQGLSNALAVNVKDIAVFTSASETFSQRNTHCSIDESLNRIKAIVTTAQQQQLGIRAYISCVMDCPFEGQIAIDQVTAMAKQLQALGIKEISLGDTIGTGTPERMHALINQLSSELPVSQLAVHCHDTHHRAIDNILAAVALGVRMVDSSAAGLGGCPYAPGASGNVATEKVIWAVEKNGLSTGVDANKIQQAAAPILDFIARAS